MQFSNQPILIEISPGEQETLLFNHFNAINISYTIVIEDLCQAIQEEKKQNKEIENEIEFNFERYHTYEEIVTYLNKDIKANQFAQVKSIGKSYEGRNISVVVITNWKNIKSKEIIVMQSLTHAKEWITGATTLFIINQLITNEKLRKYLDIFEFHIIPVLNPDGYAYTWKKDRLWRKTRSFTNKSMECRGVDANRNFGSNNFCEFDSKDPCSPNYCGDYPFSEPETASFRNYILEINKKLHIKAYFSIHAYKQLWLFPHGYNKKGVRNFGQLKNLSEKAVKSIESVYGTKYKYGPAYDTICNYLSVNL